MGSLCVTEFETSFYCLLCQSASHQREFLTSSNNAPQKYPLRTQALRKV